MKQFVIIDIEQNTVQPDGEVLIVKANEVKAAKGFEALEEMFGKKYFHIVMNESDETEVFVLPYSGELAQSLVRLARRYEDGDYWTPNMSEFMDASLSTPKGVITVHKSIVLVRRRMRAERQKYIPPVADWQFKHRVVDGIEIITFPATKTTVRDNPNGGFSWDSGDMAFFVFPDDNENMKMLNDALKLEPKKKQFWEPETSDFYHTRVAMKGPFGSTEHDLYISCELPKESILENLQDALW
jgi:hypothetical protein